MGYSGASTRATKISFDFYPAPFELTAYHLK
jgi:hypothetical protein